MNGGGCCTTRTWPPPSSTGSWNEEDSSASMDPRDGHVISNWRTPCQTVQNGSEYLEKTAQNFRNPHQETIQTNPEKADALIRFREQAFRRRRLRLKDYSRCSRSRLIHD